MRKLALLFTFGLLTFLNLSAADLHINSRDYAVDTVVAKHRVGPGTTYAFYRLPARPLEIHVLELDMTNPYLTLEVWNGGNAAVACETPTHAGQRYAASGVDVIAVHNGDFFSTTLNETGISRMGLFGAGEMIFNPTGNPLFCLDNAGVPRIDFVNFGGTVVDSNGKSTRLHTVNQLRLEWEPGTYDNQLSLYTPAFGAQTHAVSTGGTIAVIKPVAGSNVYPANEPLAMEVVSVEATPGRVAIPEDGAVLHGVGTSSEFLSGLKAGETIILNLTSGMPSYPAVSTIKEAIGGSGHIILRNGQITNINNPDVHPRTFMGISQDQKTVYSVVVDGRYGGSAGIDLDDQGRVLQWLGAWDGINLDGGGSSCMVVNGTIRNHTSDGSERAVGNGVIFYSTAPKDDEMAEIQFATSDWTFPVSAKVHPKLFGFNRYDYMVSDSVPDFELSCDATIGQITEDGHAFISSTVPGKGFLKAVTPSGLTTSIEVEIISADAVPSYNRYVVDSRRDYPLQFTATAEKKTYPVDVTTMEWTVADENVVKLNDGKLRGVENGETTVSAKSEIFTGDIAVVTENAPLSGTLPILKADEIITKQNGASDVTITPDNNGGFVVDYIGEATARGSYIQFNDKSTGNMTSYGLPESVEITINPGNAPINQVRMNYDDNHGSSSTIVFSSTVLEANKEVTLTVPLSELFDVEDNSHYPLTLKGLRFEMGPSTKGEPFTIKIPSFVYRYDSGSGVGEVLNDGAPQGANGASESMYRLDGTRVSDNPTPGFYIKGDGSKVLVK